MTNICKEIEDGLNEVFEDKSEIAWIGSRNGAYAMGADEFFDRFKGLEYDSGFGGQEVADDLVVVLNDGSWLERREYDGSEWFEYFNQPKLTLRPKRFFKITGGAWESLEKMNEGTQE